MFGIDICIGRYLSLIAVYSPTFALRPADESDGFAANAKIMSNGSLSFLSMNLIIFESMYSSIICPLIAS